jgi:hypothetical protein
MVAVMSELQSDFEFLCLKLRLCTSVTGHSFALKEPNGSIFALIGLIILQEPEDSIEGPPYDRACRSLE